MARRWFDGSEGAPGGWGPGWERRQQSERVSGTVGQSCSSQGHTPAQTRVTESLKLLQVKHLVP